MKPVGVGPTIPQRSFRNAYFRLRFDRKILEIAVRKATGVGTHMCGV
jgi:hypothetical protein